MMDDIKAARAHIDFLIDDDIKDQLGIPGRELQTQILRLCGGFNDLEKQVKKLQNTWIPITPKTIPKHSNFVRLGNEHGTTECYWDESKKTWFNRAGFQLIKSAWTHWQEIILPENNNGS